MNLRPLLLATLVPCVAPADRQEAAAPAESAAATASPKGEAPVATARTVTRGAEVFGINEAVAIPKPWIDRGIVKPEEEAGMLAEDARLVKGLGAGIVRANTPVYPYLDMHSLQRSGWDFRRADLWVSTVQAAGLDVSMVVGPWPGNRTAAFTDRYVPADMDAYAAYVRRVVERYDGDGVDDMPGLARGVRWFEVDNEPDLHNRVPPKNAPQRVDPAKFETPADYAQVFVATAKAIRAASPEARVATAGFFTPHRPEGRPYLEQLVAQEGFLAAADVVNFHCYFDNDDLMSVEASLRVARELFPGKPLWITETSVPSGGKKPWQTLEWQARMVAAVYGGFLAGGADRVFWHALVDPPLQPEDRGGMPFATNSLLRVIAPPGVKGSHHGPGGTVEDKPAGALYRRLAARMADVDMASVREEPAEGGRLLATDKGWLAFWGSPALPAGATTVEDLLSDEVRPAEGRVRVTAPAWIPRPTP